MYLLHLTSRLSEHDIPVLIRAGLLNPVGKPPPNAMKYFATVQILELAGEIAQLSRIRNAVYEHWHHKNAAKSGRKQYLSKPNLKQSMFENGNAEE
ncbi:MAG: hypothetical protein L0Z50_40300 [Verrucomicrobiales bacterium]|nr:hypothetical protein [Verrucomicrobiales bacterium]